MQTHPLQVMTDIGQALANLAEIARTRSMVDVTESTIYEPGTLEYQEEGL